MVKIFAFTVRHCKKNGLCYCLQITVNVSLEQKRLAADNAPSRKSKFNTPF